MKKVVKLPGGYVATFIMSEARGFRVQWEPCKPRVGNGVFADLFLRSYQRERNEFIREFATMSGINVLMVDESGMKSINPETIQ